MNPDYFRTNIHKLRAALDLFEKELEQWEKVSQACPPNEEKKSLNEGQNASTNSNSHTNSILKLVSVPHANGMLRVRKNPFKDCYDLEYVYYDFSRGKDYVITFPGQRQETLPQQFIPYDSKRFDKI